MTERTLVEQLVAQFHAEMRGAVCLKLAETLTSGIPDLAVSALGHTSWIEVKYQRAGQSLRDVVKKELQVVVGAQLAMACNRRCWFVVYEEMPRAIRRSPVERQMTIWTPKALHGYLWPQPEPATMGRAPGVLQFREPTWYDHDNPWNHTMYSAINYYRALRFDDWPHERVVGLVRDAVRS